VFETYLSKIPIRDRYSSLLKQYNRLIQQELPSTSDYGVLADLLVPLWVNYNLREQLELLHILIMLTSQIDVTIEDFDTVVDLLQVSVTILVSPISGGILFLVIFFNYDFRSHLLVDISVSSTIILICRIIKSFYKSRYIMQSPCTRFKF
jgi:hypothetical protein